uniref:Uncharacterized protein n=2 Tax=Spiroplasma citri TaxID=2133 RepID=Q14N86_SPICI|nr:hypothetical protein SPICI06_077 [Spiroplasma citri]
MLQAIKKIINKLNQINLTLSQYQNFQLWLIKIKETKTTLTLEVWTNSGIEYSENTITTTIELGIVDETALSWCYESLLLATQQTTEKEIFWKKIMQEAEPLYQLESSSNLYLLTKHGIHFFKDKIIAFELNYYNYNILIILFAWQKINMGINMKKKLITPKNLPLKINQQLNMLNLTIYKLLLIEGTLFYQCEIDWLSNDQILAYFRTLLLLTHHHQLFNYDKHKDYWILTKLGHKLFYQIDYKKFIIKNEMMKVDLQRGI